MSTKSEQAKKSQLKIPFRETHCTQAWKAASDLWISNVQLKTQSPDFQRCWESITYIDYNWRSGSSALPKKSDPHFEHPKAKASKLSSHFKTWGGWMVKALTYNPKGCELVSGVISHWKAPSSSINCKIGLGWSKLVGCDVGHITSCVLLSMKLKCLNCISLMSHWCGGTLILRK